jgi:hypothetical protein
MCQMRTPSKGRMPQWTSRHSAAMTAGPEDVLVLTGVILRREIGW